MNFRMVMVFLGSFAFFNLNAGASSKKDENCTGLLGRVSKREQVTPGAVFRVIDAKKWYFENINGVLFMREPGGN